MTLRSHPTEKPKRQRRTATSLIACLTAAIASGSNMQPVHAFVVAPSALTTSSPTRLPSPSSRSMTMNWEELLYHAESTASAFARQSLDNNPANLVTALPIMYGAGLLTSISPCVWGLLPLTMSYISTAAGERADKKATLPTLFFAAGLASVFCTLGIVAATVGGVLGSTTTADTVLSGVAVTLLSSGVCLAMGLQLLDFVQLPLLNLSATSFSKGPSSVLQQEEVLLDSTGATVVLGETNEDTKKKQQEGSLVRTFLLGGSSALVASPCATPVLTSILAFVANSNDPLLGAILLFGYTLGYSTPLLLVAATGGQALANLRGDDGIYSKFGPWVSPLTGGILLWYGTNGLLTAVFGDPSLAGLAPILL